MEQNNRSISWKEIYERISKLPKGKYYGVPRGGQVIAGLTGNAVDNPDDADYIIDDLIDSGRTESKWKEKFPNKPFIALFNKQTEPELKGRWLEFSWEEDSGRDAEDSVARLLEHFGEDVNREGLQETPKRFVKFFNEFLNPPKWNCTTFESEGYDEMIVQSNIPFHSLCEHHIAPFFGYGTIAYIPNKRIVGLSKLARTLETFSRRLQNQERITTQIADFLEEELEPLGIAVVLNAKHMCMEMRGVKKHNTWTTTSMMRGLFKTDSKARNEIMLIHRSKC
tara:strand:+ start:5952 stop:6794 length:843 start_codon:yes stop_codon:yes gene_type:complete